MSSRSLPCVRVLPGYGRSWLSHDVVAGLVLVPQGMAYAELAGLVTRAEVVFGRVSAASGVPHACAVTG